MLISIRRGRSAAGFLWIDTANNECWNHFKYSESSLWIFVAAQDQINSTEQNSVSWEGRQDNISLTKWDRSIHFKWTSSSITIFFIFSQWSWTLWSFICQWLITIRRHEHILVHLHKYSRSTALMVAVLCSHIELLYTFTVDNISNL